MDQQTVPARDRILVAAVRVVEETGAGHLTLDRVAATAGVSKGGLLYHFKNKQALIEAMINQVLIDFEKNISIIFNELEDVPNKTLKASLQVLGERSQAERSQQRALLAAAAENPGLLEPVRRFLEGHFNTIRNEAGNPDAALILLLASEGIRFMEIFDLLPLDTPDLDRLLGKLWRMGMDLK